MITPLRRRHRWLAPGAFGAAIVGLGVALGARPDEFIENARPSTRPEFSVPDGATVIRDTEGRFDLVWTAPEAAPSRAGVARRMWIVPRGPISAPDLLVYLVSGPTGGDGVPEGAQLLGPAHPEQPTEFELPGAGGTPAAESILIYSLGHGSRVATVMLATDAPGRQR